MFGDADFDKFGWCLIITNNFGQNYFLWTLIFDLWWRWGGIVLDCITNHLGQGNFWQLTCFKSLNDYFCHFLISQRRCCCSWWRHLQCFVWHQNWAQSRSCQHFAFYKAFPAFIFLNGMIMWSSSSSSSWWRL